MPTEPAPTPPPRRRRTALWAFLAAISVLVVVALVTSAPSGTGASDIGDRGDPAEEPAAAPAPAQTGTGAEDGDATTTAERRTVNCEATESNPGGTNNYIPDAPLRDDLGSGFVITGLVRSAAGCEPLEGVRIQVWLATATGGEQDNRASVLTGAGGRFRIRTAPTVPQFGEPNIHVAYDGDAFRSVFIRRVVDEDDTRAVVNLTLRSDG
jgi:hypothetical protein